MEPILTILSKMLAGIQIANLFCSVKWGHMEFTSPMIDASQEFCAHYTYRLYGSAKLEFFVETPAERKLAEHTTAGENLTGKVKVVSEKISFFEWRLSARGGNVQLINVAVKPAQECD